MFKFLLAPLVFVLLFSTSLFAQQLAITTDAYQSGMAGRNYSAPSDAIGEGGPYTWGIAAGTLPAGTTIDPVSGVISGTPAVAGRSSFTVQVSDTLGGSAGKAFTVDILPGSLVYDSGGNDYGTAIATDGSGHIYVAGYSFNGTNNDYRTIKYDTDGSSIWVGSYDSGGDDQARGIAVDASNNVYVAGTRTIIKYDQNGEVQWTTDFGGSAMAVATDAGGNVYVAGATGSNAPVIKKYDAQGGQIWSRNPPFGINGMALDEAGNIILIGFLDLGKYDGTGLLLWSKRIQSSCATKGGVATDPTGSIYGTMCNLLFKASPDGDVIWQKTGGGADAIAVRGDDIFTTSTYTTTQQVYYNFTRWKTDGAFVWSDYYGGNFGYSYPAALVLNTAGDGFFVTGQSASVWGTTTPTDMRTVTVLFPKIAPLADMSLKPGVPFTVALKAKGGVPPYTYSCNMMSTDPATGVLTGTFAKAGNYDITCQVMDTTRLVRNFMADRKVLKFTVYGITTTSLPYATVGSSYSTPITIVDGVAPFQWSITSGTLPPGLSLDNTSGTISGTPAAEGSWNFTVQALDAEGSPATASLGITVYQPLTIATTSLPIGNYGAPYNQTIAATGGKLSYTWSVVSGSLPPGFTLNSSTGAISGAFYNTGIFNFIVQVRDANGATTTQNYTLYITQPLVILTETLVGGTMASPYVSRIYGAYGVPPYNWQVTAGAPPVGMVFEPLSPTEPLSASGQVHGMPLAPGNYTFTVQLTDAMGTAVTRQFSINIQPMTCSSSPVGLAKYGTSNYWEQYVLLQGAYDAAGDLDTILPQAVELTGSLVMNKAINIAIRGGNSCSYQKYTSYTVLHGDLAISAGSVEIEDLIIM